MSARVLDVLFDRFRRGGDIEALGEVFDRTAPELVRIATSLVRDPHEADDLVQQTFLTAIERAARYDATRRLEPWLLGILVHHARELRERNARQVDPTRLEPRTPTLPDERLLNGEIAQALERALGELPRTDREVLEAYLRAGKGAVEIARESGLAPGAVRMRIHRGLDRLRRALPAGIVLGGALDARGSGAVRARVVLAGREALQSGPLVGIASSAGLVGGILMSKKIAAAVVLLALAAGYYFFVPAPASAARESSERVALVPPALPRPSPASTVELAPTQLPEASTAPSDAGRTRVPPSSVADPERAGLRGRVVESGGAPVAGLPVALLELRENDFFAAPPELQLVTASARTDAEGVFVLQGASFEGVHALGLDLGGPRAALRMLEANLAPGTTADIGDVVMPPCGAVAGRVVDEDGQGVAGARVRIGALPEELLALGLDGVSAGGAVAEVRAERAPDFVFELPAWLSALEAKLPLATTTTGADGAFALERVPAGSLTALVDAAGFARLTSAPFLLDSAQRATLAPFVLARGQTALARVRDADGKPVPGAEVRAGTQAMPGGLALLGPARTSDGEGRCALEHLVPGRTVAVLARRDALAPWLVATEAGGEFVAELGAEHELVVELADGAGAPVSAPQLFLRRTTPLDEVGTLAPPWLARTARPLDAASGRFALGPLADGHYEVAARATGLAQASGAVDLGAQPTPVLRLTLEPQRRALVRVLEASTGRPLAGALVRAEKAAAHRPRPLCSTRSDADGRAALALPERGVEGLVLRVEHPRFAPATCALDARASFEVALSPGARLVARVDDAQLVRAGCALQLMYVGDGKRPELHLPRLVRVPREGEVVVERLQPGKWEWDLFDSTASLDPLAMLGYRKPVHHGHGEFELAAEETRELALDARGEVAVDAHGGASLSGLVRVAGGPAGAIVVDLCPLAGGESSETVSVQGQGGRFRLDGIAPGEYCLIVRGARSASGSQATLVQEMLRIEEGEARELEYDVERLACRIHVLAADGKPAEGAEIALTPLDEPARNGRAESRNGGAEARTGRDGSTRLALAHRGRYSVLAKHAELGVARGELEVGEGGVDDYSLTLSPGVACAGTLRVPSDVPQDTARCFLWLAAPGDPELQMSRRLKLEGGRGPFRFAGLTPGKYLAYLYVESTALSASFELPEWGDGALELSFETQRQ